MRQKKTQKRESEFNRVRGISSEPGDGALVEGLSLGQRHSPVGAVQKVLARDEEPALLGKHLGKSLPLLCLQQM